ncbi:hypothetical protein J1605_010709 [Eschrichtius robustus]|uniref:Uncharacterized protein n=1 Tax=Eschrichtius robustus TaxID=9764 RepID=A0AB34GRD8_ESCRO|nr:hypothetical protein J1605_010709 [Eschrichtius robustus]
MMEVEVHITWEEIKKEPEKPFNKEKTFPLLLCVFTTSNISHHGMDTFSCRNVQSNRISGSRSHRGEGGSVFSRVDIGSQFLEKKLVFNGNGIGKNPDTFVQTNTEPEPITVMALPLPWGP